MQAQQFTEFKKVATIGYIISGLGLGLWSTAPLPRLNLMGVGAVASSVALSPVRKRLTQKAIEEAKRQLDQDHADRRQQLKDWESDLTSKSTDLESRQRDLEQLSSKWEQQRVLADSQTDRERTDRRRELESEWQQRFDLRAKEIEDEYRSLDAERKTLDIEQARFESERERFERHQEQERETLDKQLQHPYLKFLKPYPQFRLKCNRNNIPIDMNDFWQNVSRYPRYFITFTLGVLYSVVVWLKPLAKKPVTLVALLGLIVSSLVFVTFTLRAMLGLSPVDW